MDFWRKTLTCLENRENAVLIYVVHSSGSSPGRQGFRMLVTSSDMFGSVGGGIMEHKMVELARNLLFQGRFDPFVRRQIHQSGLGSDRSGMICSGEQTLCFIYLDAQGENRESADLVCLRSIVDTENGQLILSSKGLQVINEVDADNAGESIWKAGNQWQYTEPLRSEPLAVVIGSGHVGLAVSRQMKWLGFRVLAIDNREGLNTLEQNVWAEQRIIADYDEIDKFVPEGPEIYVILVSFGYRTDAQIIRKLLGRHFRYFGVMGSISKMEVLLEELRNEGFSSESLAFLHTPVGLPINSETPAEIAVSIAAEIISIRNKRLGA